MKQHLEEITKHDELVNIIFRQLNKTPPLFVVSLYIKESFDAIVRSLAFEDEVPDLIFWEDIFNTIDWNKKPAAGDDVCSIYSLHFIGRLCQEMRYKRISSMSAIRAVDIMNTQFPAGHGLLLFRNKGKKSQMCSNKRCRETLGVKFNFAMPYHQDDDMGWGLSNDFELYSS